MEIEPLKDRVIVKRVEKGEVEEDENQTPDWRPPDHRKDEPTVPGPRNPGSDWQNERCGGQEGVESGPNDPRGNLPGGTGTDAD